MSDIPVPASQAPVTAAPGSIPGVPLAERLITLRAAFGQDEANHGTARFLVNDDGLIEVPVEAVFPLTTTGGFVFAPTGGCAISVGVIKLHHDAAGGCSYAGCRCLADLNGDVLVPAEAVCELMAHGFVSVLEQAMVVAAARAKSSPSNRSKKG